MIRAVVVEDSRLAREGLVRMLAAFPGIEVVGQAGDVAAARALVEQHRPDVLFLDIHLPGGNGVELLEQLDELPRVIFTTAFADCAIRSFDFDTVDYLLKPVSQQRLAVAVRRLMDELAPGAEKAEAEAEAERAPLEIDRRVFLKDGERCHLIPLRAIRRIESCRNCVQVFFTAQEEGRDVNRQAYLEKPISAVEARRPAGRIFRASRPCIVNLHAVSRIDESTSDGFLVTLDDGTRQEISRRQAAELKVLPSLWGGGSVSRRDTLQ